MSDSEIKAALATSLEERTTEITAAQAVFFDENGRYAQGIPTHTETVKGGVPTAPDKTGGPPGKPETWADLIDLPATMGDTLQVDRYEGPGGKGFVVYSTAVFSGVKCRRSVNVGPESYRSRDWTALVLPPGAKVAPQENPPEAGKGLGLPSNP